MLLLTQNMSLSIKQISERLGLPLRTLYRNLDALRQMGFIIVKSGTCYRIDRSSPFFQLITEKVHFTDREAITLRNALETMDAHSPEIRHLKEKLARLYGTDILQHHRTNPAFGSNLNLLYRAIRYHHVCILRNYHSPNSGTVTDRKVEPFQFLSGNEDVRCYELSSGTCKTFKVERIEQVTVIDSLTWANAEKHKTVHTDLFHFSSEEQIPVTIQMNGRAAQLLREEYPVTDEELRQTSENQWTLSTSVCNWKGIGRFVLGLMGNIISVEPKEFRDYLTTQIKEYSKFG